MQNLILWPYPLKQGHTDNPADGACAMAAIAHLVEGKHTDQPSCVSPVLRAFTIPANDVMGDKTRQRFLPYLHRLAGSVDPDNEQKRCRIVVLAALRVFAPMALDSAGLYAQAENLRKLPDDIDMAGAAKAARAAAEVAWHAARAVARAVARAARAAEEVAEGAARTVDAAWEAVRAAAEVAWEAAAREAAAHGVASAMAAGVAEEVAARIGVWNAYFEVLDQALNAGKQGDPWSADAVEFAAR